MAHAGAATPRGPSRVESAWARDVAARSGRFAAPLLRRRAGMPGVGAGVFSRTVRRGLVMPRALVRPVLATAAPADRAGPALPFAAQHTEMGLSHHHLYTLLAWLANRYDVGGERAPGARPGRDARPGSGHLSFSELEALLSGSASPAGAPTAARRGGQPRVPAALRTTQGWGATAGFLPVPPALRFAQGLNAIAGIVPAPAGAAGDRLEAADRGGDATSPSASIIAGPWLTTRLRRAAARVPTIRPPAEMVRSPQVVKHLSDASSDATPPASPSGARREPAPSRRTLTWSASTLWNDQTGHGHAGSGSPDVLVWRPTVPAIGALPLSAGSDSPRTGPVYAGPATAALPRSAATFQSRTSMPTTMMRPAALPAPFGLPPGLQRTAMTSAAPADWPWSGPAWSEGVQGKSRAATAPGALAHTLSRNVFVAPDTVQSHAPIGLAVLDQPRTLQPSGAAREAALSANRPPRSAFIGHHPTRHALALSGRAAFVAEAGLSAAPASGSWAAAGAARVATAEALRPESLPAVAARAHSAPIAPGLRPVASSLSASAVPPVLTPVAHLSTAPSQLAALLGLAVARALPLPAPRPALLALGRGLPATQRIARGTAPLDATPTLRAALALAPAARAYLADDSPAGAAAAQPPTASVYDAHTATAVTVRAGALPRTRRGRRASRAAGVAPVARVRPWLPGHVAPAAAAARLPLAPTEQQVGHRVAIGRQVAQRMALGTPFAALSRTLALVARIQRAPGALSLPAYAAVEDVPPAPLGDAQRRGYGLISAGARPVARTGLPSRGHGGGSAAGWPASSVETATLTPAMPTFMPGTATLIPAMPTFTPGVPTLVPGRDAILSPFATPPPALIGLPRHALAHTVSLAGLMLAPPSTPAGFVPPGSLRESIDGNRRPAGVASGRRRAADSYPPVARDGLIRHTGVSGLNAQRSAASVPAAASGVARLAGEPGPAMGPPLWRQGLGGRQHSVDVHVFVERMVAGERPGAHAAPWLTTHMEPPESAGQARLVPPALASPVPLALAQAARLALAMASRLDARPLGRATPHAAALPFMSRLMPSWPGRADTAPASGARSLLRGALSQGQVSPAAAAPAVLSRQPSLLSIVPTTRPAPLSVVPAAQPALRPFLPSARPSLSPILRATPVIQELNAGTTSISAIPTLTLAATAAGTPAAGIAATSGPATEDIFTAAGAMPATLAHPALRGESIANAASSHPLRSLATPAYSLVAPEHQPARSGIAMETLARGRQSLGRRAEVRAPSTAPPRSFSLVSWARRVAVATEAAPAWRDLVNPGLVSPITPVAAPDRQLTTPHTMTRNAGIQRAEAEQSRSVGTGQARLVGYGANARTNLAGGDHAAGRAEWPRAGAFYAPPLRPLLAPLARFLPPAWLAAASRLPSGDLQGSSVNLWALPAGTRAPSGDVRTSFSGVRALPLPPVRAARALPLPPRTLAATAPAMQPALLAPLLQRKALPGAGEPGPLQRSIAVARAAHSVGRPLDAPARALMETALARDLAPIRLHTDAPAGQAAAAVGARAFTLGRDVFFAPGAYQPHTPAGLALLGHELVHTGQQAAVQRQGMAGASVMNSGSMAAIGAASELPTLEAQAARTESSLLTLFSARSVPVGRQAAESGAGRQAAWTASLPGHTAVSPALSMGETPRALYHQPVAAIQRAASLSGAAASTALAATPRGLAPVIGAARGRAAGAAARGLDGAASSSAGAALRASASAPAPAAQSEAAQAALPYVEDLVAQVLRRVKQELRLDHERAGGFLSDLMR